MLLAGVGRVAHAQNALESKLTMALTIGVTTDTGSSDDDTKIAKIRFNTKDFIASVDNAVAGNAIKSVVITRAAVQGNTALPVVMLNNATFQFRDPNDVAVAVVGADLDVNAFDLDGLGAGFTDNAVEADNDKSDTNGLRNVRFLGSEGAEWIIDVDATAGGTDAVVLDMLALDTLIAKRKFDGATDLGLWLSSRSAAVHGGFDAGATAGFGSPAGAVTGLLTGTIKMGPEKITPP